MTSAFSNMRQVALLSTYYENIGDDLIREGVIYQLRHLLGRTPRILHTAKSNLLSRFFPVGRPTHAPVQRMPDIRRRRARTIGEALLRSPLASRFDKVKRCDLFVIAGTPIFYFVGESSFLESERTYSADWPKELFDNGLDRNDAPPLIALGLGSIYEGEPEAVLHDHPEAREFLVRFLHRARFVTVRDTGTELLLRTACPERNHVIHRTTCPSLWAARSLGISPDKGPPDKRVLISYSLESASWNDRPNVPFLRERVADWTIEFFRQRSYEITLVGHNDLDTATQRKFAEKHGLPAPIIVGAKGLLREACNHALSVTWRVHGSLSAISVGKPVVLFRTDSRHQVAADLGATVLDDCDLDRSTLHTVLEKTCAEVDSSPGPATARIDRLVTAESELLSRAFRMSFAQ